MKKNTLKKAFAVTMSVMMMAMFMTGCGGSKGGDENVLVIGGSGPLTGDYSTYGISVKQGAQLAVDEINKDGGVNGVDFKLLFEDDMADPTSAASAYATMADQGMQVSLAGTTSGACLTAVAEAEKDGILAITPSASQVECAAPANAFRICFTDPLQGAYAAEVIKEQKLGTKIAVIYDKSNDYSTGIQKAFEEEAANQGLEVVTSQAFTNQSNTDFSVQLQAVKNSGADLVFLPIYAQEGAYILTQAQKLGIDIQFMGGDGLDGVIEKAGADNVAALEDLLVVTPFYADEDSDFVKAYEDKYGATPDQFAADGYDAVYAIKAAMEKSGAVPSDEDFNEKMISAMTEITVAGVTGTMTWDASGEPTKSASVVQIKAGKYVLYK